MSFGQMFWLGAAIFSGGYAACWFTKDKVAGFFVSAETQIRAFEDKIKALRGKV